MEHGKQQLLRAAQYLLCPTLVVITAVGSHAAGLKATQHTPSASNADLAQLIGTIRIKAKALESSTGMRLSFRSFIAGHNIPPEGVSYSDYVIVRLLYEATRDAGFWNLHWTITNQPPNTDKIWQQWRGVRNPSSLTPTASAECDELSALYAFLAGRTGVKGVGLFWPFPNHTVAVWVVHPPGSAAVRVVVPTSQIFLDVIDFFGIRKFNPLQQKSIHAYTRQDVPDSFEFPKQLFDFFLSQVDKYAGASDSTLQQLRYLREGIFLKYWTPETAAQDALRRRGDLRSGPAEDLAAFQGFAEGMRSKPRP